jgi:site-specific DNA recombinase
MSIENGVADLSNPMLKDRIGELKATRDQARLDAERSQDAIERAGPTITPLALKTFAATARKRMRTDSGGYRRDHLRALPSGSKSIRKNCASSGRKAYFCGRSSPLKAQERRVLERPALYRNGAPFRIKLRIRM